MYVHGGCCKVRALRWPKVMHFESLWKSDTQKSQGKDWAEDESIFQVRLIVRCSRTLIIEYNGSTPELRGPLAFTNNRQRRKQRVARGLLIVEHMQPRQACWWDLWAQNGSHRVNPFWFEIVITIYSTAAQTACMHEVYNFRTPYAIPICVSQSCPRI